MILIVDIWLNLRRIPKLAHWWETARLQEKGNEAWLPGVDQHTRSYFFLIDTPACLD